jgi:hypothetical protein
VEAKDENQTKKEFMILHHYFYFFAFKSQIDIYVSHMMDPSTEYHYYYYLYRIPKTSTKMVGESL